METEDLILNSEQHNNNLKPVCKMVDDNNISKNHFLEKGSSIKKNLKHIIKDGLDIVSDCKGVQNAENNGLKREGNTESEENHQLVEDRKDAVVVDLVVKNGIPEDKNKNKVENSDACKIDRRIEPCDCLKNKDVAEKNTTQKKIEAVNDEINGNIAIAELREDEIEANKEDKAEVNAEPEEHPPIASGCNCITQCALTYRRNRQNKQNQDKSPPEDIHPVDPGQYSQQKRLRSLSKIQQKCETPPVTGNFKLIRQENYEGYLKAIGVTPKMTAMVLKSPLKLIITEDLDLSWVIQYETEMKISGKGGLRFFDKKITRNRYQIGNEIKEMLDDWDNRDVRSTLGINSEKTQLTIHQVDDTDKKLSSTMIIEISEEDSDDSSNTEAKPDTQEANNANGLRGRQSRLRDDLAGKKAILKVTNMCGAVISTRIFRRL